MSVTNIVTLLEKKYKKITEIERALICSFFRTNNINEIPFFFQEIFNEVDKDIVNDIVDNIESSGIDLDVYAIVEFFEQLIPNNEKKVNGMVYTPKEIKDYIIESLHVQGNIPIVCDPACGCGSFLLSAAQFLHEKHKITYNELFSKYIYGVDIIKHNIEKTKILFHLLALSEGEELDCEFNLICANSLELDWEKRFNKKKFDWVIGNPPYVRSKNIQDNVKKSMKKCETANSGNADLYIPFYELGMELLKMNGKLGYISLNTFTKSLNGKRLRNYLLKGKNKMKLVDFSDIQVFERVTSYTCIVIIEKNNEDKNVYYSKCEDIKCINRSEVTAISYKEFAKDKPWKLATNKIRENIHVIENTGFKLGEYKIRNGLATLKNDVYFFKPVKENENYYFKSYGDRIYKIEKNICVNIAKPNIIKSEEELAEKLEKAIFPYKKNENSFEVIEEHIMEKEYPFTYKYLKAQKKTLQKRDKGKGKYPAWYAYGRTQGFDNFGSKLLIPCMARKGVAVKSYDKELLFYCGYAVFTECNEEMDILKKVLESEIFWYYIENTSKPYSKGYYSLAKNYLKSFGIPKFTNDEKNRLLCMEDEIEINSFLKKKYGVSL